MFALQPEGQQPSLLVHELIVELIEQPAFHCPGELQVFIVHAFPSSHCELEVQSGTTHSSLSSQTPFKGGFVDVLQNVFGA